MPDHASSFTCRALTRAVIDENQVQDHDRSDGETDHRGFLPLETGFQQPKASFAAVGRHFSRPSLRPPFHIANAPPLFRRAPAPRRRLIDSQSDQTTPNTQRNDPMKTLATLINVIAFSALFFAYASGTSVEKPTGVRRALQTYAGQLPTGAYPTRSRSGRSASMPAIWSELAMNPQPEQEK